MNFKHGGDIKSFATKLNCSIDEIIDLSSNINFIKPEINIDFNKIDISSYPSYDSLYQNIANLYDIDTTQIELFNGASSGIYSLFKHFTNTICYIYSPAYLEYKKAALSFNYTLELINRFVDIDKDIISNSLVIFVNPSTPDGTFYDIDKLMQKWIEKNCTILIDESFLEFTSQTSAISYIEKYDKLYILKSLTKFYSSAGIRIGSVISNKTNIEKLKQNEPAWKISQFDMCYIEEAIKDKKFVQITKTINITNKEYLKTILKDFRYTNNIVESQANYILVELKNITASKLQELLEPYKIMVRDCSNFDFLDSSFVRIAVKSRKNLDKFKEALNCI